MTTSPLRLVVVDDEPLVRAGVIMMLAAHDDVEVVGEGGTGVEAVRLAARLAPHVVLLDLRMPVMGGAEATGQICSGRNSGSGEDGGGEPPAVLILSTFADDEGVYEALRAGASGYLLKSAAPTSLIAAVRAVAAGDAWLDPPVARRLLREFSARPAPSPSHAEHLRLLTARELEILTLVGQGLDNARIATTLTVAEATVRTHVGRIFTKLDVHDRAQAVVVAYRSGLVR